MSCIQQRTSGCKYLRCMWTLHCLLPDIDWLISNWALHCSAILMLVITSYLNRVIQRKPLIIILNSGNLKGPFLMLLFFILWIHFYLLTDTRKCESKEINIIQNLNHFILNFEGTSFLDFPSKWKKRCLIQNQILSFWRY